MRYRLFQPPNGLRSGDAALSNGKRIVADTDAEKRAISPDAKRRPLQRQVGRPLVITCIYDNRIAFARKL